MSLAQRRGETDEEYEKRKKRVKRQRQGTGEDMFARMGGGGGGGVSTETCITQGTDGTNFGMKKSLPTPFGSISPTHTEEGVLIYDFYCQASGEIVLRLGDDGEYEVPGIVQLDVTYNTDQVMTMTWLALENMYVASDHDYTDYATAIPVDEEYCVKGVRIPVDLPTAPTLLRVGATTDTSISLLWDASTQGTYPIANYRVEADEVLIGSPASNAFTWNACPPNEEVVYRVKAVDNQGNVGPWSNLRTYTNEVDLAPIYLMTEPLFNDGSFDYLVDSSGNLTDVYYGQLLTSTDTAWNPTTGEDGEYPQDGTIDFSGGNKADTQWTAPQDTEWTMSGVYNVVSGVSYDMYSIHYKGNQTCDIYLNGVLSESDKDYTPPTGTWIIEEEPPDIIIPATEPTEVYISFNDSGTSLPPPSGYTVNQVVGFRDLTTVHSLVDKDNVASQVTIQSLYECQSIASTGKVTGDDSGCMSDTQIRDYWGISYGITRDTAEFSIYLPAGTWSLQFGSSRDAVGTDRTMDVTFDGVTKQVDGQNDVANNCALWEGFVSAGEYVTVLCTMPDTSLYGQINGITLMGELT